MSEGPLVRSSNIKSSIVDNSLEEEPNNHPHNDVELLAPLAECKADNHVTLEPLLHKLWIACHILELHHETRFTSLVLLHRYYAYSTGKNEEGMSYKWIGAACLLLGCKMEETSRRLRDFINVAIMLDFGLETNTDDSTVVTIQSQPPDLNSEYWKAKEDLVAAEQAVLRVLAFEVTISHPHRLVKILLDPNKNKNVGAAMYQPNLLLKNAWRRLNDSLFWAPALTHSSMELALAAIQLSSEEQQQQQQQLLLPLSKSEMKEYNVDDKNLHETIRDLKKATATLCNTVYNP